MDELGWKGKIPRKHLGIWCTKRIGKKRYRWVGTKVDCPKRRELWKEQGSQSELRNLKISFNFSQPILRAQSIRENGDRGRTMWG